MVKVLENRIVDLDIMPGTAEHREAVLKAQAEAKGWIQKQESGEAAEPPAPIVEYEDPAGPTATQNATNAASATGGALGGAVKGLVDTTGNTVGALGEGLGGTVLGLGKGLGSAGMYSGKAVGGAVGLGGKKGEGVQETKERVEAGKKLEETGELPQERIQMEGVDEEEGEEGVEGKKGPRKIEVRSGRKEGESYADAVKDN